MNLPIMILQYVSIIHKTGSHYQVCCGYAEFCAFSKDLEQSTVHAAHWQAARPHRYQVTLWLRPGRWGEERRWHGIVSTFQHFWVLLETGSVRRGHTNWVVAKSAKPET